MSKKGRLYRDTQDLSTYIEITAGLNYELMVEEARLEAARRFGVPASRIATHAGSLEVAEKTQYRSHLGIPEKPLTYRVGVRCTVMPEDVWKERQESPYEDEEDED